VRTVGLLLLLVVASAARLPAQRLAVSQFPSAHASLALDADPAPARDPIPPEGVDVPKLVLGGVLGGTAGLFAGAVVGHRFDAAPCEDCIEGALYGAFVGEAVGAALGVHLANGGRGDVLPMLGVSVGIAALGFGLAAADHAQFLIAVPIAQIASAIGLEAHAARAGP
jgi:hypothetical protein